MIALSDDAVMKLLGEAPISFVGTVENLGAATMSDVPIDDRTAVVSVEHVLHGPDEFAGLAGQRVTLQLAADTDPPKVGESLAFFAQGLAFGESVAVSEIGRLPVDAVEPHASAAMAAGESQGLAPLQRQIAEAKLRAHADEADALVVGRVMKLEKVLHMPASEHDPDWWAATIDVYHAEKGDVKEGEVKVLYPNSKDVRWSDAPKPKASQGGLWTLHATEGDLREQAPFQILHPEDFRPTQDLEAIRGEGG